MSAPSTHILVTGANGFLGRHVVETLRKNYQLTCLVRKAEKIPGTSSVVFKSFEDAEVEEAVKNAEVIVHIAAQLHGPWDEMYAANVAFTRHLVTLGSRYKLRQFIYISSENVTQGNEDIYSKTKALGEAEAAKFPQHLIIRPTIIYGPGDTKYVGRLVNIIKKFPLVPVLGNGKSKFQFVYVDDLVQVIEYAILNGTTGTFTIAGPESMSYNDFMQQLMRAMGTKKPLLHLPMWLLKPMAHVLNVLFSQPPLTPTQLDNLSKDRVYEMQEQAKLFQYEPVRMEDGLHKILGKVA